MSLTALTGQGIYYPAPFGGMPYWANPPAFQSQMLIDATGEKVAFCGYVWFSSRTGSKNITRIQFRFGNITKAGGSALTLSLQDASTTTAPLQPDETQDQTVAVANSAIVANTWIRSNALSATRQVSFGDLLCVVWEFDGAGRLGSDSIVISTLSIPAASLSNGQMVPTLKTSGAWATQSAVPLLVLEFDDGTYGTLNGCVPYSALGSPHYGSTTAVSDEYALPFTVPVPCKIDALWAEISLDGTTSDYELILYNGTTVIEAITVKGVQSGGTGSSRHQERLLTVERELQPGNTYYVSVRPTTSNQLGILYFDVADANFLSLTGVGSEASFTTRADQGSWAAATTTRRFVAGVRISSLDNGAGGMIRSRIQAGM
jgi:hypothetical protein